MKRTNWPIQILAALTIFAILITAFGCSKERIVESTEYVHDIEYIELPADTVRIVDTVVTHDSVMVSVTDTITIQIHDTVTIQIHDTLVINNYDTVVVYDTTITYQTIFDTTVIVDTVQTAIYSPDASTAFAALQSYSDPIVMDFVNTELGLTDGWIYYLSMLQSNIEKKSTGVYNITGYIDYWALDWSGYYPLEYFWEIRYISGDPADASNWSLGEPSSPSPTHTPGINLTTDAKRAFVPAEK